jgi:hypothetical protein
MAPKPTAIESASDNLFDACARPPASAAVLQEVLMQVSPAHRLDIPDSLRDKMLAFRKRLWSVKLIEAVAAAAIGVLAGFLAMYLVDRLVDPPRLVRWAIFAGAFLTLLAGPTLFTMLISGVWHGAGWVFVLWGLVHGVYLTLNHAWRMTGPKLWPDKQSYARVMAPVGFLITFVAVAGAMVLFRAPSVAAAGGIYEGMFGLNGIELPWTFVNRLAGLGVPAGLLTGNDMPQNTFILKQLWLFGLLGIALFLPISLQMTAAYEPVLGVKERRADTGVLPFSVVWNPTLLWVVAISALAVVAISRVGGPSEFLYWQF